MSVLTTFIIKKIQTWTEPISGKDEPKPKREFWTAAALLIYYNRDTRVYYICSTKCVMRYKLVHIWRHIGTICMFVKNYGRIKHPALVITFPSPAIWNSPSVVIRTIRRLELAGRQFSSWNCNKQIAQPIKL